MSSITRLKDFDLDGDLNILSKLSPVETYLLLYKDPDILNVIKIAILDLMLNQVLVVKNDSFSLVRNEVREYTIVETGANFVNHDYKKYETYFTEGLGEDLYFHLKPFMKNLYDDLPSESKFYDSIREKSLISDCFKDSIFSTVLPNSFLNEKGELFASKVKQFLIYIDHEVKNLMTADKESALELLLFLKGNIFLLDNINFSIFDDLKLGDKTNMPNFKWCDELDYLWYEKFNTTGSESASNSTENSFTLFNDIGFSQVFSEDYES